MSDTPIILNKLIDPKNRVLREASREIEQATPALLKDLNIPPDYAEHLPMPVMIQITLIRILMKLEQHEMATGRLAQLLGSNLTLLNEATGIIFPPKSDIPESPTTEPEPETQSE